MPIQRPTLPHETPYVVKEYLRRLADSFDAHELDLQTHTAQLQAIVTSVTKLPVPLTIDQIRAALAATDAAAKAAALLPAPVTPVPVSPPPTFGPSLPQRSGTGWIRISGKTFINTLTGNSIWPWRGATDFLLFKRFLDGDPTVEDVVADRVGVGANLVRVLGMARNITVFEPSAYPDYFTRIGDFADMLGGHGLQLEFCVFADAQFIIPAVADQKAHLEQVANVLVTRGNTFGELVNEYSNNGVNPANHTRPAAGVLFSAGSNYSDVQFFLPAWDQVTYHSERNSEWPRQPKNIQDIRDGFPGFAGVQRPVIADEPMGAGDADVPGARATEPDDFFWYAACAQMMGAGSTFHSDNGIQSQVYDGTQRACALAFFAGAQAIPPEAQTWVYTRGGLPDCPVQFADLPDPAGTLRTFAKINGNQAVALAIRPNPSWVANGVNGWRIVSTTGPGGTVIFLER